MKDLTTGPVAKHLLQTTGFMLVTMLFQTLYFLTDLYWVGRLGTEAVAAVGLAGNLNFIVLALTQMVGVGTTAVVSHAVGRREHADAQLLFNQSQVLAMATGVLVLVLGLATLGAYASAMSADAATERAARQYLYWFIPALALQFALVAMGAALRAIGNFKPGMIVSSSTVLLNIVISPVLMFGWGTGRPLGVAGAAIGTLIAIAVGIVWFTTYFTRADSFLRFDLATWKPRLTVWRRMIGIGLPTGCEFAITAVYMMLVYAITRPFGAAAQAGFGIGMRIVQSGFMPVVALGFSVAPVAGQNFGARLRPRVIETFRNGALMAAAVMLLFALLCNVAPHALIGFFSNDPAVITIGEEYLRIISWNFVASGVIFVASSMFQAMGNTIPSLVASAARITLVAVPAVLLSRLAAFQLAWLWYLSVATVFVQLGLALLLLRREFARRLDFASPPMVPASA